MAFGKSVKQAAAFVLSLAMVFTGIPAEAFGEDVVYDLADGTLTIVADGNYTVTGTGDAGTRIIVEANRTVTLTLSGAAINGDENPGILVEDGAELNLILEGDNRVESPDDTAVALAGSALLRIDGEGSLSALGGTGGSYGAGIGDLVVTKKSTAKVIIDGGTIQAVGGRYGAGIGGTYSTNPSCAVEINGGMIVAEGGSAVGAGIGAGNTGRKAGRIEINGGNIAAMSHKSSIADIGAQPAADPAGEIIINGGSITDGADGPAAVQGASQGWVINDQGEAVVPVIFTFEGLDAGIPVIMEGSNGSRWTARAENGGKLYSFFTAGNHPTVTGEAEGALYYATDAEVDQNGGSQILFSEYSGADCVCTADNSSMVFAGETIEINPAQSGTSRTLKAAFQPAEECTYPIHRVETVYETDGDSSLVGIEGDRLTVQKSSGDYTFHVTARTTLTDRNFTLEGEAEYQVKIGESASFDLSAGNLIIGEGVSEGITMTKVTQLGQEYFLPLSDPVIIEQSGMQTYNYIEVVAGVSPKVLRLVDLKIQYSADSGKALINLNSNTTLDLRGTNELDGQRRAGIRSGIGTLQITGPGMLTISTMGLEPAIGGSGENSMAKEVALESGTVRLESTGTVNQAGIYTVKLLVNGGSLFSTLPASLTPMRELSGEAEASVYPVAVQIPGGTAGQTAEVRILEERDGGTPQDASDDTDTAPRIFTAPANDAGELRLWLAEGWNRVKATVNGRSYYKRIKITPQSGGSSVSLIENPQVSLEEFQLPSSDVPVMTEPEAMADGSGRLYSKVTLNVSTGVDLSSIEPHIQFVGSEYCPQGAVNLEGSSLNGFYFTVIGDGERSADGARQETIYDVWIKQESAGDKPTTLYVGNGDILIAPDGVRVSGQKLPPNPLGYVLRGKSERAHVILNGDLSGIPVVLRDLELSPTSGSALRVEGTALIITEGSSRLTGGESGGAGAGSPAVALIRETGGELTVSGSGLLDAQGGTGAPAFGNGFVGPEGSVAGGAGPLSGAYSVGTGVLDFVSSNVVARGGAGAPAVGLYAGCRDGSTSIGTLKIGAANVRLINGEPFDSSLEATPQDADGRLNVYPIEITIWKSANQPVSAQAVTVESYCDGKPKVEVSAITDEDGKLWIWRDDDYGNYTVSGTFRPDADSEAVTYFGQAEWDNGLDAFKGVLLKPSEFNGVRILPNSPAVLNWEKGLLNLQLIGEGLSGNAQLVLTPTGPAAAGYRTLTASAVSAGSGTFSASFEMPEALSTTSALCYDVMLTVGSEVRLPIGGEGLLTQVERPIRPAITDFAIPGQLGETVFESDPVNGETITVELPYDQPSMVLTPDVTMAAAGTELAPEGAQDFGRNGAWITYSLRLTGPENAWTLNNRTYKARTVIQKEPRVTALELTDASGGALAAPGNGLSFKGGKIQVHLTGANLANVTDSVSQSAERGKYVVTLTPDEAAGMAETLTAEAIAVSGSAEYAADFDVPDNGSHTSVRTYEIDVRASGVPQNAIASGPKTLTVGIRPDSNTQLLEFALPDQNQAVITENATYGSILVEMPTGTNLASMSAVVPTITLASITSTYSPVGPVDFTSAAAVNGAVEAAERPVEFTVTALDEGQRTYLVGITVAPAPSRRRHKKKEEVTPGAITVGGIGDPFIPEWWENGYISGYEDGTFRPDQTITRGETAVILAELWRQAGDSISGAGIDVESKAFRDVSPGAWYEAAVVFAGKHGLMAGYEDGTFRPGEFISREEFLTVLTRFGQRLSGSAIYGVEYEEGPLEFSDAAQLSQWAERSVGLAFQVDLIQGYEDGTIRPKASITRAEAIALANRMLRLDVELAMEGKAVSFVDLRQEHWAYEDILAAVRMKGEK